MNTQTHKLPLILAFLVAALLLIGAGSRVLAGTGSCDSYAGSNAGAQDYRVWSSPVTSYLTTAPDGTLMRVQAGSGITGVLVEYYDASHNLLRSQMIAAELPIFGGFYETASHYYLFTGQTNEGESDSAEVMRATKYDKSWNRLGAAGLFGANTTVPFDAGSLRVAELGKYLLVRTCHEMYTSSDGYNHQANVTFELDTEAMTITDSFTGVKSNSYGYVSHSFNQFIAMNGSRIVAVDHGDAYPRSLVLTLYGTDASAGSFSGGGCQAVNLMEFSGEIGQNATGASAGGFEISSESYLVAGNSVVQDGTSRSTRNIFVTSVSKTDLSVTTRWLTNYAEGEDSASTPQLVCVGTDSYVLLWSQGETVFYTTLNGRGEQTGQLYSMHAQLSDCKPYCKDGKLIWYVWDYAVTTFYEISLSDLGVTTTDTVQNGHKYVNQGVQGGYATLVCSVCGAVETVRVPDSLTVYWNSTGSGWYSTAYSSSRQAGDVLYYMTSISPDTANGELEVLSSDEKIAKFVFDNSGTKQSGRITFLSDGTVTLTIRSKYHTTLSKSYTFTVGNADAADANSDAADANAAQTDSGQKNTNTAAGTKQTSTGSGQSSGSTPDTATGSALAASVKVRAAGYTGTTYTMVKGTSLTLKPIVSPSGASQKVTYRSGSKKVATVTTKGVVKAVRTGTAKITVTAADGSGKKTTVTIRVVKKQVTNRKLTLKSSKTTLRKKDATAQITVKNLTKGTTDKLSYKVTSGKSLIKVDAYGLVTAKKSPAKKAQKAVVTVSCGKKKVKYTVTLKK